MAKFTFADFQVFAGTSNVNEATYVTIARGVIDFMRTRYGLYPEIAQTSIQIFAETGQTSFALPIYPICTVYRVSYDGTFVDDTTYSYYGEDVLFDVAPASADIRKPVIFELDVGFENGVPDDLVLAMYRHILAVYFAIDKHTDNIEKSINAKGNTIIYRNDVMPIGSMHTYEYYAGRTLLDF